MSTIASGWHWIVFNVLVVIMLMVDLFLVNRSPHRINVKEALAWSIFWVVLAIAFYLLLSITQGPEVGLDYLAGYLIEKSLSVDNLFVFLLILRYFKVDPIHQHGVLFWGVLGAIVMRALFIFAGVALITAFHWMMYVFGVFLVMAALKMLFTDDDTADLENSRLIRLIRRFIPLTDDFRGSRFFVRENGRLMATPLFAVLLFIEASDVIFAVDSIPAIFAITTDPFIVYTSNIFAILGLRSLYFVLAGMLDRFRYLKVGLSAVLGFVGFKMLVMDIFHIGTGTSLAVISGVLTLTVTASILAERNDPLD